MSNDQITLTWKVTGHEPRVNRLWRRPQVPQGDPVEVLEADPEAAQRAEDLAEAPWAVPELRAVSVQFQ